MKGGKGRGPSVVKLHTQHLYSFLMHFHYSLKTIMRPLTKLIIHQRKEIQRNKVIQHVCYNEHSKTEILTSFPAKKGRTKSTRKATLPLAMSDRQSACVRSGVIRFRALETSTIIEDNHLIKKSKPIMWNSSSFSLS